ncbi:MAG: hypothetical protein DWQ21_07235 [Bacteroidetes bacterium]|nr:MAG: hypothetical protein DWQ21_07235 [Bacteroidota bacterium]REK64310.1 MAG: hypothetical protein DWQ49_01830 [Bacteroidota bacterium]
MRITNKKQLEIAVHEINDCIMAINEYLGEGDESRLSAPYLIRIPPRYIRTADQFRAMLSIPITSQLKTNIAYHLILSDLYSLLLNRYNVWGTLREMVIKSQIVNIAAICESILVQLTSKNGGYDRRVEKLLASGKISKECAMSLKWLWDKRKGIHLFELDQTEYDEYEDSDFDKALITLKLLIHDTDVEQAN